MSGAFRLHNIPAFPPKLFLPLGLPLLFEVAPLQAVEHLRIQPVPPFVQLPEITGAQIDFPSVGLARRNPEMSMKVVGVPVQEGSGSRRGKRSGDPLGHQTIGCRCSRIGLEAEQDAVVGARLSS